MNTRAIYFKDGKSLTVTEEEFYEVKKKILAGAKHVHVQNTLISTDNIARVGSHDGTAEMIRREEGNEHVGLPHDAKLLEVRRTRKMLEPIRIEDSQGMTADEDERGNAMYWVDENGQKMYS